MKIFCEAVGFIVPASNAPSEDFCRRVCGKVCYKRE